jgi:hypothetical protein
MKRSGKPGRFLFKRSIFTALKNSSIIFFSTVLFVLSSCNSYNKLLKSTDYDLKFTKAKEYYDKGNYIRAAQLYEELIPVVKGTDRSEEVQYYYNWSEYYLGDYILSQYHFKSFTRQFPTSPHAEESYYMNAYLFYLNSPNYKLDQNTPRTLSGNSSHSLTPIPKVKGSTPATFSLISCATSSSGRTLRSSASITTLATGRRR